MKKPFDALEKLKYHELSFRKYGEYSVEWLMMVIRVDITAITFQLQCTLILNYHILV